jgi:hypothetical protein
VAGSPVAWHGDAGPIGVGAEVEARVRGSRGLLEGRVGATLESPTRCDGE